MIATKHFSLVYDVIEHFDDEPPEPFGVYLRSMYEVPPKVGNVISLRWLDGRHAYYATIESIDEFTLHVRDVRATR